MKADVKTMVDEIYGRTRADRVERLRTLRQRKYHIWRQRATKAMALTGPDGGKLDEEKQKRIEMLVNKHDEIIQIIAELKQLEQDHSTQPWNSPGRINTRQKIDEWTKLKTKVVQTVYYNSRQLLERAGQFHWESELLHEPST